MFPKNLFSLCQCGVLCVD
uniref:Uncharacterized protein n=1 Tax=Anguilla anguilla TaxID=7936 RepID=A0A0E9Q566_ANGAN